MALRISLKLLFIPLIGVSFSLYSQVTVVKGKVIDAASGDPLPFVNVVFVGTSIGATTDFEGNYTISTDTPTDSLLASYIGYNPRKKVVEKGISQVINFQLEEQVTRLKDIVFEAGENPAFEILRNVVRNKEKNDKRKLSAYEYDTYSKIEIDIDNMSEEFRQKKLMRRITTVLDSIDRIAGEDGKPILPIFISESISRLYYRSSPDLKTENILNTKISGVGFEDGSLISQLIGSSFQEYNFYKNWLDILGKDFVSPIADGWRLYYDYDLVDSLEIDGYYCYRLDFFPKSPQDLAFTGTMWITKNEFALKQIEASVGKQANLNFIEKIKIQQELEPSSAGAWIPSKNRVLLDVGEVRDKWAGMLAKFYTSNKDFVVNKPKDPKFYEKRVVLEEDYILRQRDEEYWNTLRHEPLTETEKHVYQMIDTLQNIPVVRTYIDVVKILINGYKEVGKVDLGPYISIIALNNIEGVRVQSGFRTNIHFSNRWVFGGQFGYGFQDQKIKYSAMAQYILDRDRWTTMSIRARSDLGRVGIDDELLADDYLFLAASRFGNFRRGYYFDEARFNFQRELVKGYSQRVAFKYNTFRPTFNFAYLTVAGDTTTATQNYETAEVIIEARFARDEIFVQDDNERLSLGPEKWPIITLRYTHGIKGVANSDFDYDKFRVNIFKRFHMGMLGVGNFSLTGEYIFDALPYSLLTFHLGNETPFYTDIANSLMNFGEFVTDRSVALQYRQHFEGFLLNRIPLMRKLKWRLTALTNVIYGGLSDKNQALISDYTPDGEPTLPAGRSFEIGRPYMEVGYGVENIFKIFRIDFVHRLSYLDLEPGFKKPRPFGFLFTVQLIL